ncbi:MAG: glucose-6-phosphate isomerase, partial [Oscillospiraceae bacterium]|nr:glucose-6-phosphate isomerase [Oscillospiraceae bacterium]
IQDGPRTLMETVVAFENSLTSVKVPFEMGDPDGLNYLAGRDFFDVCNTTIDAVRDAHVTGGVPNIRVNVERRDEAGLASLICFFEMACAISAYMSGVNPFNQPGVEEYKKNMFAMLKQQN